MNRINEALDRLINKQSIVEETKRDMIDAALNKTLTDLMISGASNIKEYEIAFQDTLEKLFPEKLWWQITNCNIFMSLLEHKDPIKTIFDILDNLTPEFEDYNEQLKEELFKDISGIMGEVNATYSIKDLEDAWKKHHESDPSMAVYDGNYHAWLSDTLAAMSELDDTLIEADEKAPRINLKKHGIERASQYDFYDDGNRFTGYLYKDMPITYLKDATGYYLSPRPDYLKELNYAEYSKLPSYKDIDKLNGVSNISDADLTDLISILDRFIAEYKKAVEEIDTVDNDKIKELYDTNHRFLNNQLKEIKDMLKDKDLFSLSDYLYRQVREYYNYLKRETDRWIYSDEAISKLSEPIKREYLSRGPINKKSYWYEKLVEIISEADKLSEEIDHEDTREYFHNSNGTTYEVIERSKSGTNALLYNPKSQFTPWIIAWNCPKERGSWGQGHYIRDEQTARDLWQSDYVNEDVAKNSYKYDTHTIINDEKHNCWRIKDKANSWVGNSFATDAEAEEFIDNLNDEYLAEADKSAALSIEDAQKWVDFDMERYGHISEETNMLIKRAGFQIVRDTYGEYEVIAGNYDESLFETLKNIVD